MPHLQDISQNLGAQEPLHVIVPFLEGKKGSYFKVDTLHSLTGVAPQVIIATANQHPDLIRESLIKDEQGQSLYLFNAPLSGIADAWTALRQTAYLKTEK